MAVKIWNQIESPMMRTQLNQLQSNNHKMQYYGAIKIVVIKTISNDK